MDCSGSSPWFDSGYMFGVSLRGFVEEIHTNSRGELWEMTSCRSPYSALSLVRQRIHALRKSMELLNKLTYFYVVMER